MNTDLQPIHFLEKFVDFEDTRSICNDIINEITWVECDWVNDENCSKIYIYSSIERKLTPKPCLEKFIKIVESELETRIIKLILRCYVCGEGHMCPRSVSKNKHSLHVMMGCKRKIYCYNTKNNSRDVYSMRNGDALYVSKESSENFQHCVPSNSNIKNPSFHICAVIEEPYSFRHHTDGTIHVLGVGDVNVLYDTRKYPDGLPRQTTAIFVHDDQNGIIPRTRDHTLQEVSDTLRMENIINAMEYIMSGDD